MTTHRQLADIRPTSMLTSDLGLDSLARVELAVAIEQQFGVAVSDEAMGQADTVADLEHLIASSPGEVLAKEFPSWPFSALATRARTVLQRTLIFPLLRLICRPLVVVGEENLSQVRSPVLIVANHGSHLDAPLRIVCSPATDSAHRSGGSREGLFLRICRSSPAGAGAPGSVSTCSNWADSPQSGAVWAARGPWPEHSIFPEGTRSIDGSVGPFKAGIGLLARELRIPVVPIGIHGARDRLPKGRTMPVPGSVRLSIGPPVLKDTDATDQIFADRLREQVIALLD